MKHSVRPASIIVTDEGFRSDDRTACFVEWTGEENLGHIGSDTALDIPNTLIGTELAPVFDKLRLVRIPFPTHTDGRGFSIARMLRLLGYEGRLRASGSIVADQYAMARRCGFDEVEIDRDLAERQPETQWLFRADWQQHDYQQRLRGQGRCNRPL